MRGIPPFLIALAVLAATTFAAYAQEGVVTLDHRPAKADACMPFNLLEGAAAAMAPGIEITRLMPHQGSRYVRALGKEGISVPHRGEVVTLTYKRHSWAAVVVLDDDALACLNRSAPVRVDVHVKALGE